MFAYLLKVIQDFERTHGHRPQVICLNPSHMQLFMEECPDLFDQDTAMPLGFRIMILPENELPHPKAMWLPPRKRNAKRGLPDHEVELISWQRARQSRKEAL
jgi:hypothetical protein